MEKSRIDISSFTLKLIAIGGMTCNHIANAFGLFLPTEIMLVLYSLGGLTFPIMAFLIGQGYIYTSNVRRYALRLFVFALISQIPYSLLWGATANILFTLLIGLGLIYAYEHMRSRGLFFLVLLAGICISYFCDWGIIGPLMIFLFYYLRDQKRRGIVLTMLIPFVVIGVYAIIELIELTVLSASGSVTLTDNTSILNSLNSGVDLSVFGLGIGNFDTFEYLPIQTICFGEIGYGIFGVGFATLLLCGYRNRRGYPLKWAFYVFYPSHLLVIWIVAAVLFF